MSVVNLEDYKMRNSLLREEERLLAKYNLETGEGYYGLQNFRERAIKICKESGLFSVAKKIDVRRKDCLNRELRTALKDYREFRQNMPDSYENVNDDAFIIKLAGLLSKLNETGIRE